MIFLFLVTDFYDLFNIRFFVERMSANNKVFLFMLTTPLKGYRILFRKHSRDLQTMCRFPKSVSTLVGDFDKFHSWTKKNKTDIFFGNASAYMQLCKFNFLKHKANMGKICLVTWGFDGTEDKFIGAYEDADYVIVEGPKFFESCGQSCLSKYGRKIIFSHPYYDWFAVSRRKRSRANLKISLKKDVFLIPETGNIVNVEKRWLPLYRKVISEVQNPHRFILFKGRYKVDDDVVKDGIKSKVDRFVNDEWIAPPLGIQCCMASDACIMPCESKFALESLISKRPTCMYSTRKHKSKYAANRFSSLFSGIYFLSIDEIITGTYDKTVVDTNYETLLRDVVVMNEPNNSDYLLGRIM